MVIFGFIELLSVYFPAFIEVSAGLCSDLLRNHFFPEELPFVLHKKICTFKLIHLSFQSSIIFPEVSQLFFERIVMFFQQLHFFFYLF